MAMWKCFKCGHEQPDFDVAHVCSSDVVQVAEKPKMHLRQILIHGYSLQQTCGACPEQYDVYDSLNQQVAYFRLRHGNFRVDVPDVGGETIYTANPEGDGAFMQHERVRYLTEAILAVQEYYINRKWDKENWFDVDANRWS